MRYRTVLQVELLPLSHLLVVVEDERNRQFSNDVLLVGKIGKTVNIGLQTQLQSDGLQQRSFGLLAFIIAVNSGEML